MKPNFFTTTALRAGLESADSTVGVDAIHTQDTLQPKPGFTENKEGEDSLDDVKADKTYGEDADIADHDEIDTVAESQEHTLALEHLHESMRKLGRYCTALEEIAENIDAGLAEGQAMDPTQVAMLTTAIDASGVGEPLSEGVALESFDFDARVATEGFVDTLKDRAGKVRDAIARFAERAAEEMKIRYGHLQTALKFFVTSELTKAKTDLAKVDRFAGRNFEDSKREKKIQSRIAAPSSSKSPLAALKESLAAYEAATDVIDTRMVSAIAQATRAWNIEDVEKSPAALNRVLEVAAELAAKHSRDNKYSTIKVEFEAKKITAENATKLNIDKFTRTSQKGSFDNSLKVVSVADLDQITAAINKAQRIFLTKASEMYEVAKVMKALSVRVSDAAKAKGALSKVLDGAKIVKDDKNFGVRRGVASGNTGPWDFVKICAAYRYTMYVASYTSSSVEMGLAEAVYRNASACIAYAKASIAEAKAMNKNG